MKKDRLLSLVLVLLMMIAAAITVNRAVFGHSIEKANTLQAAETDSISVLGDGTVVIHTGSLAGTTVGYAGPVPLDIYISGGKISDIKVLPNAESPSFFKRAEAILPNWIGKTPDEALEMKVDGVSGATYSSNAIKSNMEVGLACYEGSPHSSSGSMPLKLWVAFGVTLAACIVPLFVKKKWYHNVQMVANIIVLGFWSGQFLDYALILKYISDGFILPSGLIAIAMLIAAFIYPIFGKPQHYCTHICPLGSAQQLAGQLWHKKLRITPKVLKGLDWFRRILWGALMLCLWFDCLVGWMDLELFQAFQFQSASLWIIVAACLFVALSTVVNRPYCRFVCPTGSLFKRSENNG